MDPAFSSTTCSMLGDGGRITVGESPEDLKSPNRSGLASITDSSRTCRASGEASLPRRSTVVMISLTSWIRISRAISKNRPTATRPASARPNASTTLESDCVMTAHEISHAAIAAGITAISSRTQWRTSSSESRSPSLRRNTENETGRPIRYATEYENARPVATSAGLSSSNTAAIPRTTLVPAIKHCKKNVVRVSSSA